MRPAALLAPLVVAVLLAGCRGSGDAGASEAVILATTTSTQDSGLLDVLVPAFERDSGYTVKTVAVGSGQAIELGRRGEADVVLAHSPAKEHELVDSGVTGGRFAVMHNDFVLVGPESDPAAVGATASVAEAMTALAAGSAPFVSRGDESGTHTRELALWEGAGIVPGGDWYQEAGQGMGVTLQIAAEKGGYTLADRGTYLATLDATVLAVVLEGDPALVNSYHVIPITKEAGSRVNEAGGAAFAAWIVGDEAQELIRTFGKEEFGEPLFVPDAIPAPVGS